MTEVFVIRNQLGHFWGKKKCWVDGSDARIVMRLKHHDQAINTLFELGSKNFELRGEVVAAELSPRGEPMVEASKTPLPEDPADIAAIDKPLVDADATPANDAKIESQAEGATIGQSAQPSEEK